MTKQSKNIVSPKLAPWCTPQTRPSSTSKAVTSASFSEAVLTITVTSAPDSLWAS